MSCVGTALRAGIAQIGARIDAEILLAWVLDQPRSRLIAYPEQALAPEQQARYHQLTTARATGTPLAYLTGLREFWSLNLHVTQDTLIPRPDTETLVAAVLDLIPAHYPATLADLGTGCGAIALALAHERPHWQVFGVEQSTAALTVARANADRLGLNRVTWLTSDWLEGLPGNWDILVSNPPYLAADDPHLPQLRHEPRAALVAGTTGLEALATIIGQAKPLLAPDGWLLLEHGATQGDAVLALLHQAGYRSVRQWRDLAGWVRVSGGCNVPGS